ncbi:MAG: VacJ family lipoprotein [Gammaproteobacteria bacterium]|nr:VacJ family lipoprotein [Gammaproteobacteria bacterium]
MTAWERSRLCLLSLALAISGGCASTKAVQDQEAWDPIEPFNRAMYKVNDIGDRYLLRPVAVGYERGLPPQMRGGIRNFFSNIRYPITIVNDFLQGKFRDGGRDTGRFILNTTVGLFGFFDPATRIGLQENDEDFGQTLGKWGVGEGPYLVLPVFGPYTLRSLAGNLADSPLTPLIDITDSDVDIAWALWGVYQVDKRSRLLEADQQVFEAYDPYLFVRDAYLQNRRYRMYDGNVPEDDSYLDDMDDMDDMDDE